MHVGIVGADVLLSAAVRHRAKAQRRVLLRWLLKLFKKRRWVEIKGTVGMEAEKLNSVPSLHFQTVASLMRFSEAQNDRTGEVLSRAEQQDSVCESCRSWLHFQDAYTVFYLFC